MKRHVALHGLTSDHHHGLALALRIKRGMPDEAATLARLFLDAYAQELLFHFRGEEEVLLPAFAQEVGDDHPLIVRTLIEHIRLHRLADRLRSEMRQGAVPKALLNEIAQTLEAHIRFEEEELLPAVEAALSDGELMRMSERLPLIDHTVITEGGITARYALLPMPMSKDEK